MTDTQKLSYLQEINIQCEYAISALYYMRLALVHYSQPDGDITQKRNLYSEVFRNIHSFLNHTSNVSKLIWAPTQPKNDTDVKRDRRAFLISEYAISTNNALNNRDLRNNLEHYDERLDTWNAEGHGFVVPDMILDPARHTMAGVDLNQVMRWYNPKEGKFYFRGIEFSIQSMLEAVNELKGKTELVMKKPWLSEDRRPMYITQMGLHT